MQRAKNATGQLLLLVALMSAGSLLALPLQAAGLNAIRIDPPTASDAGYFPGWETHAPFAPLQLVDVELGDQPFGTVLHLLPAAASATHRVAVQFETSMSISNEGPHIDLLDWKHCRSDWQILRPTAEGGWVLPMPSDAESSCFPPVTTAEIRTALAAELRAQGLEGQHAQQWLSLLPLGAARDDLPAHVGISAMRVRIEVREDQQWREVTTLEFKLPLGC